MNANDVDADATPARRAIGSREQFVVALHDAVGQALARGARRMLWADADFADWPLDDPALLQRLTDWVRLPRRQLVLLAADYDSLRLHRARFVAWYRLWSHAVSAYSPSQEDVAQLPCVLLAERAALLHLPDRLRWRGWVVADAALQRVWGDRLDAVLQRSERAFAATTLGL